jgi:hypothetical protein
MIAKMKILAIIFSLVIGGSAATLAISEENESGCRDAPETVYAVHLAEVEARYDHEIYLLISSEDGEPVCGIVYIIPPKLLEKECREDWEEKEGREEEEREERESEEERERDREEEEEEEMGEEREEEDPDERSREKKKRLLSRKRSFRFNFEEGKGRLLLFPSSHRCLGATAMIIMRTQGEVRITPFIFVKNTDVVVYPDSEDEEGNYCKVERNRGRARYGFEDLLDSPDIECDWDYDDVVLCIKKLPKKHEKKEGRNESKKGK